MPTRNTGSGDWNDGKTWSDGRVPNSDSNLVMDRPGTVTLGGAGVTDKLAIEGPDTTLALTNATLTIDTGLLSNNSGNLRAVGGTNSVTAISNQGSVFVEADAMLKIGQYSAFHGNAAVADGGTLDIRTTRNLGDIALSSTGKLTTLKIAGSLTTELDPNNKFYSYKGGNVLLSDSAQNLVTGTFTNVNNTISGAGTIRGSIVNMAAKGDGSASGDHSAGIIRATGLQNPSITGNKLILELDSSASYALRNGGIIESQGGRAGLVIRAQDGATAPAKVLNTGLIAANAHTTVSLENLDIQNAGGRIAGIGELGRVDVDDTKITGGSLTAFQVVAGGKSRLQDVDVEVGSDLAVKGDGRLDVIGGSLGIGRDLRISENASLNVKGSKFSLAHDLLLDGGGKLSFDGTLALQEGALATINGEISSQGAMLRNFDTIAGTGTIRVAALINDAKGLIDGSLNIVLDNHLTDVRNAGSIVGARITGSVNNTGSMSDVVITGNKVINAGTMSGITFHTPTTHASVVNDKAGVINGSTFGHTDVANSGLIQASGLGSKVVLAGTTIHGGTLSSSNGGVIAVLGNTSFETLVDARTIGVGTTFQVGNGATLRFEHRTVQQNTLDDVAISVSGTGKATQLSFDGHWLLDGNSWIALSNLAANKLNVDALDIVHGKISGSGTINVEGLLDNQAGGIIEANDKNSLTIRGTLENDGRLEADGGTLKVITDRAIHGDGEVLVTRGGTVDLSDARQFHGALRYFGRGTILGPDQAPAGIISGFATGDSYVFGRETAIKGELGTIWQANADGTGGTLTIKAGTQTYATLQMAGIYSSTDFAATRVDKSDGKHIAVSFVGALNWLNPVTGNWQTAANWGPTRMFVPGADDDALIAATGGRYAVTSSQDVTVKSVATGSDATLYIRGGTFTASEGTGKSANTGTVRVEAGAHFAIGGTFTQSVNGRIVADDTGTTIDMAKAGAISGGNLFVLDGAWLNAAKGSAMLTSVDIVNEATISVANNTRLTLANSMVSGPGTIAVGKGSTLTLADSVIRNNTVNLDGTLELLGDEVFRGLAHLSSGKVASGGTPATFTNAGTIDGTGTIGDSRLTLVNDTSGRIATGNDGKITISTGANVVVNKGRIEASSDGSVELASALDNTGTVVASGGTVSFAGAVTNGHGDTMQATGTDAALVFKSGLNNSGKMTAGDDARIDLAGTVTQSKTGKIEISGDLTTLNLNAGASLTGGSITASDGAAIFSDDATITNATVLLKDDSAIWVLDDSSLTLAGGHYKGGDYAILGTLTLADALQPDTGRFSSPIVRDAALKFTGKDAALVIRNHVSFLDDTVTLEDGARIMSDDDDQVRILFDGLLTSVNGTISGEEMTFSTGFGGTITTAAEADATLVIDIDAFNNSGTLSASVAGSTIISTGGIHNFATGTVASGAGTVTAGALHNDGLVQATAGGRIEVQGSLTNRNRLEALGGGVVKAGVLENRGKALASGDGSLLSLGTSTTVRNFDEIAAEDGGAVTLAKGVQNAVAGSFIIADEGGLVKVLGAATGGSALINGDDAIMDFEGDFSQHTTTSTRFGEDEDQGHGQLILNNSRNYTGTMAGFAEGDTIDVKDVKFVAGRDKFVANRLGGVLVVGSGSMETRIQLLGSYAASDFAFSSDGSGGTLITGKITADPAFV